MAGPTSANAMISATVDEFSFMFANIPNGLPAANNKKCYPSYPHQDFVVQINEKLGAWNGRAYPLSSPISEESFLSSPCSRGSSTIDRSNPYDLYGLPTDESATPAHTLFLKGDDSNCTIIPAASSSEPKTPAVSKFQTVALETPCTDQAPPPAYRETSGTLYSTHPDTIYHSRLCYVPFGYAKLPHFHPPRFSRRLRMLIAERRRPMTINLLPLNKPQTNEKQVWIIASPDSALLPTPRNALKGLLDSFDPRLVVFASLVVMMLLIFIIALTLTELWQ